MEKTTLEQILSQPFDQSKWNDVLRSIFGVSQIPQRPKDVTDKLSTIELETATAAYELTRTTINENEVLGFYRVELTDRPRIWQNRVGLRQLLRKIYQYDVDAALVVFVQGDKWRLSPNI